MHHLLLTLAAVKANQTVSENIIHEFDELKQRLIEA